MAKKITEETDAPRFEPRNTEQTAKVLSEAANAAKPAGPGNLEDGAPGKDANAGLSANLGTTPPPVVEDKPGPEENKTSNGETTKRNHNPTAFEFDEDDFLKHVSMLTPEAKDRLVVNLKRSLEVLGHPFPTNEAAAIVPETDAEAIHAKRLKLYGPGYVAVEKRGTPQKTVFTAHAWKNLGPAKKDGSKEGWHIVVETPPEVRALQAKKDGKNG